LIGLLRHLVSTRGQSAEAGYHHCNNEIHDYIRTDQRDREAHADALATVEQFNARVSAKKSTCFWPTIAASYRMR
jgi:hypothetical protein